MTPSEYGPEFNVTCVDCVPRLRRFALSLRATGLMHDLVQSACERALKNADQFRARRPD